MSGRRSFLHLDAAGIEALARDQDAAVAVPPEHAEAVTDNLKGLHRHLMILAAALARAPADPKAKLSATFEP